MNHRHSKKNDKKPFGTVTVAGRGKKLHHHLDALVSNIVAREIYFFLKPAITDSTFFAKGDKSIFPR